jgi:cytosine/uracil/thiamine/allantoin permease
MLAALLVNSMLGKIYHHQQCHEMVVKVVAVEQVFLLAFFIVRTND